MIKMKQIKFFFVGSLLATVFFSACTKKTDEVTTDLSNGYKQGTTEFTVDKENATVTIKDLGEGFGGNYTMSADTTYILDGLVFVNDGQVLTVNPGTMIQGKPGQGENASALIVARGGKIMAEGTADKPIILTALGDDKAGSVYGNSVRGLWGGLILLGKGTTSNTADKHIEGIPETEARGLYGGSDDNDNSGVIKYVSIRHGGTDIGSGNEINGLTCGAVGSATVIDYLEVIANIDDGIEFFGGAPIIKHAVIAYCGDDSYDYDEGFHGKGQFWFTVQSDNSDRCGEHDGGPKDNEAGKPYSFPHILNATYIGNGGKLMVLRDNAGTDYENSIFVNTEKGIRVEYRNDLHCSYDMFTEGFVVFKNNIFSNVAGNDVNEIIASYDEKGTAPTDADTKLVDYVKSNGNVVDANLGVDFDNLVPASGKASNGVASTDAAFDKVSYQGAFEPGGTNWAKGWTLTFK